MTWTAANVSAAELAAFADDRPVLVGANALTRPSVSAKWRDTNVNMTFVSFEEPGEGGYLVHSGGATPRSRPSNLGLSTWHLLFELVGEFDMIALINTNFAGVASLLARVQIADDTAYSSGLTTVLADFTPTGARHIAWTLGGGATPQRYTGSGYGLLRLAAPAGFRPEIGAVWLGRRRQLRRGPDHPYDERARVSALVAGDADGGFEVPGELYAGRRELRATLTPDDTDATLRDTDTLRAWWRECRQGSAPFLWARAPSSAPTDVALLRARGGMAIPDTGAGIRQAQLDARELPPYLAAEGL